MFKTRLLMY